MGQRSHDFDVKLITAAGVDVPQINGMVTLVDATTYYAEIGGGEAGLSAMQWIAGALLVAAITYESTNLRQAELSTFAAAASGWFPEAASGTTSFAAAAAVTMQHFSDFGARRMRAKIVVTTGGAAQLRGRPHFKTGS